MQPEYHGPPSLLLKVPCGLRFRSSCIALIEGVGSILLEEPSVGLKILDDGVPSWCDCDCLDTVFRSGQIRIIVSIDVMFQR